ncbi:FecR family protein [Sphingomonas sp. CJ20]
MTRPSPDTIDEAARRWALRVQDASFDDWDGLSAWLESDPAHLAAYDLALDADAWAVELLTQKRPPMPMAPARAASRGRWFAAGGAMAAALVAAGGWTVLAPQSGPREIATAAGEHRTVDLGDGSRVILNGNTRITLDPKTPREVALAGGEALFQIKHDAERPFVVTAHGTRLIDVGTVFNVVHDGTAIDVAVAEGAVDYSAGRQRIRLNPGDALSRADAVSPPALRKASPQTIGSWQTGQLQYDDAPLDQVAGDLGRNTGQTIQARRGAERMRFTGTLMLEGSPQQVFARAGPLLGVRFIEEGDNWTMVPASAPRR